MERRKYLFYGAAVFCLFAFLISCENPLIEEVWGLKTVTFDTNGGGYIPQQKLLKGERILKPADPVINGYDFCGWFEDNGTFHNKWNFNTAPDRTLTLYAKWEAEPDSTILYTLLLDTSGLTNDMDTASFSESGVVLETAAFNGDAVTVYYNLEMADTHNWLSLSVNGDRVFETETPEAGTYSYTVNHSDADNGVITIHSHSAHSDLILLLPPESVHFDKTGTITFSAHSSNPSGTTYWYTLFRDDLEVDGFTNMQITSGTMPQGIVNEMLRYSGKYHVEAWAQTSDAGYQSQSG
ncbi:MAG: InlB B-repeat-containing protein, partial [Treponema sp.]|nr:InlB B-repeat-containing protein [Treponema sp.]